MGYLNDVSIARSLLRQMTAQLAEEGDAKRAAEFALLAGEVSGWHLGQTARTPRQLKADWHRLSEKQLFWIKR